MNSKPGPGSIFEELAAPPSSREPSEGMIHRGVSSSGRRLKIGLRDDDTRIYRP